MASFSNSKSTNSSHILDTVGLSTDMVSMRILSTVYKYNIENTRKEHEGYIPIPSGSVIEGICLQWYPVYLTSYCDIMMCIPDIVMHDGEVGPHPSRNKTHCVDRPAAHPGYVYIYMKQIKTRCGQLMSHWGVQKTAYTV
jgi:hypothetical protein